MEIIIKKHKQKYQNNHYRCTSNEKWNNLNVWKMIYDSFNIQSMTVCIKIIYF